MATITPLPVEIVYGGTVVRITQDGSRAVCQLSGRAPLFLSSVLGRSLRAGDEITAPLVVADKPGGTEVYVRKAAGTRPFRDLYQCSAGYVTQPKEVTLVRQSRKRLKTPRVLTPSECKALFSELAEPYRPMIVAIACLGLRVCELMGLQWGDIDFESLTVKVQRSFVEGHIYPAKTEASQRTCL